MKRNIQMNKILWLSLSSTALTCFLRAWIKIYISRIPFNDIENPITEAWFYILLTGMFPKQSLYITTFLSTDYVWKIIKSQLYSVDS